MNFSVCDTSSGLEDASYTQGTEQRSAAFSPPPSSINQSSVSASSSGTNSLQQWTCLYTKHKTQKRKTWLDGRLILQPTRAILHDAHPALGNGDPTLDECEVTRSQRDALMQQLETQLETEKFLIQVEGPWRDFLTPPIGRAPTSTVVSQGMQKVIVRKFKKPGAFVPMHPQQQQSQSAVALGKRQRAPLQPGELQLRYYGSGTITPEPSSIPPQPLNQQRSWNVPPSQPRISEGTPASARIPNRSHGQPNNNDYSQYNPPERWQETPAENEPKVRHIADEYDKICNRPRRPDASEVPCQVQAQQRQHNASIHSLFQPNGANQEQQPEKDDRSNASFVHNGFNPNEFLGEEEESDDETCDLVGFSLGDSSTIHQKQIRPSHDLPNDIDVQKGGSRILLLNKGGSEKFPGNICAVQADSPNDHQGEKLSRGNNYDNVPTLTKNTSALSKVALLRLFGVAMPTVARDDKPRSKEVESDQGHTARTGTAPPNPFEFVLPLPSDSSSDEADDH